MIDVKEKFPNLPDRIGGLGEIALNLWWTWHPEAQVLFKRLNREAWKDSYYNPVNLLHILPREFMEAAVSDPDYVKYYDRVLSEFHERMGARSCWFCQQVTDVQCLPIAHFFLEYGLHRSMPFYAGGLGFLAGDYLKERSDLGVPLVGMGLCILRAICAKNWITMAGNRASTKSSTWIVPPSAGFSPKPENS
jgi:starch phosphorylase